MRKSDLELDHEYDAMSVINDVNTVLYEQGYGIQFVLDEAKSQGEILAYNLSRSLELIQE